MPESKLFIVPREPDRPRDIPNNLPAQPAALIGREREVEAACLLLSGAADEATNIRLLTMTGPGGVGKSRLASQVAEEVLDLFADGVFLVELAPITDPDLVVPAIAGTLQVRETPGKSLLSTLKEYLQSKTILLVLDNFEQVITAGPTLADLLAACPRLMLMVTSRSAL